MNKYNPQIHHRRSIRMKGYDYSQAGLYYITICCQDRACLFGDIRDKKMILNDAGKMVETQWLNLTTRFPKIILHEFIVMPNHFHSILEITNDIDTPSGRQGIAPTGIAPTAPDDIAVRATLVVARTDETESEIEKSEIEKSEIENSEIEKSEIEKSEDPEPPLGRPQGIAPTGDKTVGDIIGAFKSIVTVEYIRGVKTMDWPAFRKRLLQRDYYEHIIRNEGEYKRITDYIVDNPAKWKGDKFHGK